MANELRTAIHKALCSPLFVRAIVKEIDEFASGCPEIENDGVHIIVIDQSELMVKVTPYDRSQPAKFFKIKLTESRQK